LKLLNKEIDTLYFHVIQYDLISFLYAQKRTTVQFSLSYAIKQKEQQTNVTCAEWSKCIRKSAGRNTSSATIHVQCTLRMLTAWWNKKISFEHVKNASVLMFRSTNTNTKKRAFTHHVKKYRIYATTRAGGNWCFTTTSAPSYGTYFV